MCSLICACQQDGQLIILLEQPTEDSLNPLSDPRLSKFGLRITHQGIATDQDAFTSGLGDLEVGTVPVDSPFDLRLAGKTATEEMLGLGLVLDVVVPGQGESRVEVKLRKPLGYVVGQDQLQVLDTSAPTTDALEVSRLQAPGITDVSATPNGLQLLTVDSNRLVAWRTADHQIVGEISLEHPATCVAASPDSRYALVCHRDARKVSVVDLVSMSSVRSAELADAPTRVVFGWDRKQAWVLIKGLDFSDRCGDQQSQLQTMDLLTGTLGAPINLGRPISSLAVDPRDGNLLVALPCEGSGSLGRVVGGTLAEVVNAPGISDLGVTDQSVVIIGGTTNVEVAGQVMSFDLSGPGLQAAALVRPFDIPPLTVSFTSKGGAEQDGYLSWISVPSNLQTHNISVTPDGRRAVALFQANYTSNTIIPAGPIECDYSLAAVGAGYLLMDLISGAVLVQRFTQISFSACRANCLVDQQGLHMTDKAICQAELERGMIRDKQLMTPPLEPRASTLLFSGP